MYTRRGQHPIWDATEDELTKITTKPLFGHDFHPHLGGLPVASVHTTEGTHYALVPTTDPTATQLLNPLISCSRNNVWRLIGETVDGHMIRSHAIMQVATHQAIIKVLYPNTVPVGRFEMLNLARECVMSDEVPMIRRQPIDVLVTGTQGRYNISGNYHHLGGTNMDGAAVTMDTASNFIVTGKGMVGQQRQTINTSPVTEIWSGKQKFTVVVEAAPKLPGFGGADKMAATHLQA